MATDPRLAIAQIRLAAQQGQQHPLAALVQGGMRGMQFAGQIQDRKSRLAQQAAHLKMLQERNRLEQSQFAAEVKFKEQQEKRSQELHTGVMKAQPGKLEEQQLRIDQIRDTLANQGLIRQQQEFRLGREQEVAGAEQRMGTQFAAQQAGQFDLPAVPSLGGPGPAMKPPVPVSTAPPPRPSGYEEVMALRRLQQPQADVAQKREFMGDQLQNRITLLDRKHGHDLELEAMKAATEMGIEGKAKLTIIRAAVNSVIQLAAGEDLMAQADKKEPQGVTQRHINMIKALIQANLFGTAPGGGGNTPPPPGGGGTAADALNKFKQGQQR